MNTDNCRQCGSKIEKGFTLAGKERKTRMFYCSRKCRNNAHRRYVRVGAALSPTAHIGAAAEHLACAEFLLRGFDVYRSVSAAGKCDIIVASRDKNVQKRIEVTSGYTYKSEDGGIATAYPITKRKTVEFWDFLSVVVGGKIVFYDKNFKVKKLDEIIGEMK